jgi:anti-sigma regulatory factor (Ser/Thr protein kinase)
MPVRSEQDIVASRQKVRAPDQQLKFSLVDQTKMITAASELSRNTLVHGGGGDMRWELLDEGVRRGLRLHVRGPGPRHPRHEAGPHRRLDLRRRHGPGPARQQAPGARIRCAVHARPGHHA